MELFGQINWEEMLGDLMVATFLILLAASIAVVCLTVMFSLIDLAFKKKAKPAPAQVKPWQQDELTRAQLSGRPWLALRSDFPRPDAVPLPPLPLVRMSHRPVERITPLKVRSPVTKRSEGARPDPGSSDSKRVA